MEAVGPQVIVQDLPAGVTEDFLRKLFGDYATVRDVVLKKRYDIVSGAKCYAFLRFDTVGDCQTVIKELNYTKLDGRPMRIMVVNNRFKPGLRSSCPGNLVVKGLDGSIEDEQLHDAFAAFGDVLSCRIARDAKGKSRGYGYAQFEYAEQAEQAKIDLEGATINGRKIHIENFVRRTVNRDDSFTNVYVRNLPASVDSDEKLGLLFSEFGEVTSASVAVTETEKGQVSRGFGFCAMKTHESAVSAVEGLRGREVEGKVLWAGRAKGKAERERELALGQDKFRAAEYQRTKDRNLFVRNVHGLSEVELRGVFEQYGAVESAKIPAGKRFGFVCFKEAASAQRCLRESVLLKVGGQQVGVSLFEPWNRRAHANQRQGVGVRESRIHAQPFSAPVATAFGGFQQFPFPGQVQHRAVSVAVPWAPQQAGALVPQPQQQWGVAQFDTARSQLKREVVGLLGGAASGQLVQANGLTEVQAQALLSDRALFQRWLAG
jgi:polyadenylate-binding protein